MNLKLVVYSDNNNSRHDNGNKIKVPLMLNEVYFIL